MHLPKLNARNDARLMRFLRHEIKHVFRLPLQHRIQVESLTANIKHRQRLNGRQRFKSSRLPGSLIDLRPSLQRKLTACQVLCAGPGFPAWKNQNDYLVYLISLINEFKHAVIVMNFRLA